MVQAISQTPQALQPLQRQPQPQAVPKAATAATTASQTDTFSRQSGPSAKAQLAGIWSNVVVGDSGRSYLLKVPKDLPAGFTLDEAKLDPADRHELQKAPQMRDLFTRLQYLETTDPKAKAAIQDLLTSIRNGDLLLRTYGTASEGGKLMRATGVKDAAGPGVLDSPAIATTGGAYSHVAVVSKPTGQDKPHVIEAIFEGGVVESGPYTFLGAMVDKGNMGERTAVTLYRPTANAQEAQAAVDYAKSQVGTPYNFAMRPNRSRVEAKQNGWYCSQLAYASYDQNPAIRHPVLNIKQDGNDANRARLTHALIRGLHAEKALDGFFTNKHGDKLSQKIPGLLTDIGKSMVKAGPRDVIMEGYRSAAIVGEVATGAVMNKLAPGRTKSPTMTTVDGRQAPKWVTPGDVAPNDGRKVMTLVFDLQE